MVGGEAGDQHSENESANGDFHGNVSPVVLSILGYLLNPQVLPGSQFGTGDAVLLITIVVLGVAAALEASI